MICTRQGSRPVSLTHGLEVALGLYDTVEN